MWYNVLVEQRLSAQIGIYKAEVLLLFNIKWEESSEYMYQETQNHLKEIEGIDEFQVLMQELYGNQILCWGDDQIDELAYNPSQGLLTVRICSSDRDITYKGKKVKRVFWMLDFYDVEFSFFDIAPEHWIDEIYIQKNEDGKHSITFGTGNLDFRYSHAKVNRCWVESI